MPEMNKVGFDNAILRRSRGPTRREVDTDKIYELASIGMSQQQISNWFGINLDRFTTNQDYVDIYNEGKANMIHTILSNQFEIAMNKEHKDQEKVLKHLGKTLGGQIETTKIESNLNPFDQILNVLSAKNESNPET